MHKTFVKTVRLRLREPTARKRGLIEEAMKQSMTVANEAAKRMPSLPRKYIKNPQTKGSPLYGIVQDLRNDGISLNAACTSEAVGKARESYLAMRANKNFDGVPVFNGGFVRLHNRYNFGKFFSKNGTYYVALRLFPREKIVLSFAPGDYQDYFLQRIIEEKLDHGTGEVVKNGGWHLNLTIKREVDTDYEPETFVGVDLGLNNIAWATALDREGKFLGETHFDGGQAGWIRNRLFKKRRRLQGEGNLKMVKRIKDRESRWMENKNHVVSRRIVAFAERFEGPSIHLEDIDGREIRKRCGRSRMLHSWTHADLRNFIEYKALEAEVLVGVVNPRNTSKTCHRCDNVDNNERDGVKFHCRRCGLRINADFNAAWNIAKRGASA